MGIMQKRKEVKEIKKVDGQLQEACKIFDRQKASLNSIKDSDGLKEIKT